MEPERSLYVNKDNRQTGLHPKPTNTKETLVEVHFPSILC